MGKTKYIEFRRFNKDWDAFTNSLKKLLELIAEGKEKYALLLKT